MHKLIIEDDEGRTTVVPLVRDELSIGRKEGNAIRLTERNVSRQHARLLKKNGAVVVEDLSSYTGVRINGIRIEAPTAVHDGDQVSIGDYKLTVRDESGTDREAPTATVVPAVSAVAASNLAATVPAVNAPAVVPVLAPAPSGEVAPDGAPRTANEAAPTIPLRTLVETTRLAARIPPARLVVVTTALGGMEFLLDRPSLVIGRTEENDIILNHPSISRHHAKVVRDGDRYTVVDLQSANGVHVSGETYERVDVQPGDVIELGHVKMRVVGPGETWTYDPREYLPKSRRTWKIGAAVAGLAVVGGVIVVLQGRNPSLPASPALVAEAPKAAVGPKAEDLLAQATTAVEGENWDKAVTALDLLFNRPSDQPATNLKGQAAALRKKVDLERRSADLYAAFEEAVNAKEPDVALTRFEGIPTESVYKGRAEPALADVKTQFLAMHLDLADAARTQGRCDDARGEVEKIEQIDPENRKAQQIAKSCRQKAAPRVAAAAPPPPPAPRPPAVRSARMAARLAATRTPASGSSDEFAPVAAETSSGATDPAELIKEARAAWLHQQCGQAIELSRKALKAKPGAGEAHQIIAVCSCSMKDRDGALKSYAKLDERSRGMVRNICGKNGIELEP